MCVSVKGNALVACYCLTEGLGGKTAENGGCYVLYFCFICRLQSSLFR